jgi:hypothetical protein
MVTRILVATIPTGCSYTPPRHIDQAKLTLQYVEDADITYVYYDLDSDFTVGPPSVQSTLGHLLGG